jgi:hypothetical protein
VPAARAADVAADRVVLLNRLGRAADALDVGERALPTTTGAAHAELCLRLARAAVHAGQWTRALGFVDRAGRPEDPRTSLLAADAAFGAGDVARAGVLAAAAVAAAERHAAAERSAAGEAGDGPAVGAEPHACGRAPAAESLCEALELVSRCAQQDGDLAAAAASLSRAASGRRRARAPQATGGGRVRPSAARADRRRLAGLSCWLARGSWPSRRACWPTWRGST